MRIFSLDLLDTLKSDLLNFATRTQTKWKWNDFPQRTEPFLIDKFNEFVFPSIEWASSGLYWSKTQNILKSTFQRLHCKKCIYFCERQEKVYTFRTILFFNKYAEIEKKTYQFNCVTWNVREKRNATASTYLLFAQGCVTQNYSTKNTKTDHFFSLSLNRSSCGFSCCC